MATYPIKPDTPVNLPPQKPITASRRQKPAKKPRKPEEVVVILKRMVVTLMLALLLVSLAFAVTVMSLNEKIRDSRETAPPGQNYSTADTTIPTI